MPQETTCLVTTTCREIGAEASLIPRLRVHLAIDARVTAEFFHGWFDSAMLDGILDCTGSDEDTYRPTSRRCKRGEPCLRLRPFDPLPSSSAAEREMFFFKLPIF